MRKKYGRLFSLKLGSYKFVIAGSTEAVREVLVTKSSEYGGRPKTYSLRTLSLGKYSEGFFKGDTSVRIVSLT